ncbi:uncharacterized protein N7459_001536 [Penicillium hispanicum]|uniref:uncharacterized protein n=1 Tax=Penicillium hispanicum TaxID=1080232 RepID=UPI002542483D|nr:uncharacterized protein N7459_001536 [Penicillium hispanicum]KAJ5595328.1 hypothetical protein N7459_001536 [Penicillium hispanicum]
MEEGERTCGSPLRSSLRLQATTFPGYSVPSLSPSFKLDEGYSDETRSQPDKEPVPDNVMVLPHWPASIALNVHPGGGGRPPKPLAAYGPRHHAPPELTFEIFSYLDPRTLLNASLASRLWRSRILDSGLWRVLYLNEGWKVDTRAIRSFEQEHSETLSPQTRKSRARHSEPDLGEPKHKKRVPPTWLASRGTESQGESQVDGNASAEADNEGDHHMADANDRAVGLPVDGSDVAPPPSVAQLPSMLQPPLHSSLLMRSWNGTTKLNWVHLYKQRRRLEANWHHGRFTNFQLPHPSHPEEAHRECVYAIQFEDKWLVSGSRDKTVRVWDLSTKRLWHRPLVGHTKSVLCLQFDPSPEEDIIISGSSDRSVILWKFSTGQKIHQIANAHGDSVLNLKFDRRYLVTCSKDRTVKVWSRRELMATDEEYPRIFKGGGASYPSYIVDLNGISPSMLEASIANGHIRGLKPYSLLMTVEGHGAAVNAMQLHGDEIVTASGDRMIKVWNIRNGTCLKTLMGHEKGIACVQFDSRRIISGSNDNTVRIYDHASGAEVACLRGHNNLVRTVQAGFGDPPGADEALRQQALDVENAFWKAQQAGAPVDLGPRALRRTGHYSNTAGSRDPRDISALGAKIPPGGGGSVWGRIVSGSYDESILIWHKDRDGAWSIGHRLRQADAAANATRASLSETARATVSAQAQQLQAAHVLMTLPAQGATVTTTSTQNDGAVPEQLENGNAPPATNTGHPAPTPQQGVAVDQIPAPGPGQPAVVDAQIIHPLPAAQNHNQHLHPRQNRHPAPAIPPTSRVFKVQFDSRKIICASVDPRIVGWDFACDDEEIMEACPFFQGL